MSLPRGADGAQHKKRPPRPINPKPIREVVAELIRRHDLLTTADRLPTPAESRGARP